MAMDDKTVDTIQKATSAATIVGTTIVPHVAGKLSNHAAFVPGMEVGTTTLTAAVDRYAAEEHLANRLGVAVCDAKDGYALPEDYDPLDDQTVRKMNMDAAHSIGGGVVSTAASMGVTAALGFFMGGPPGALLGLAVGVPVSLGVSWAYDTVVPHTDTQDPGAIGAMVREKRGHHEYVSPEEILALSLACMPPAERREFDGMIKAATGTNNLAQIAEDPQLVANLRPLLNHPRIDEALAEGYGVVGEQNIAARIAELYNQTPSPISTRDIIFRKSGAIAVELMTQSQVTAGNTISEPTANTSLPMMNKNAANRAANT